MVHAHPEIKVAQEFNAYERLGLIDIGYRNLHIDHLKSGAYADPAHRGFCEVSSAIGALV